MSTKNLIPLEKDENVKIVAEIYKFAIEKIMKNPRLLEVKTDQSKKLRIPEMWSMYSLQQ